MGFLCVEGRQGFPNQTFPVEGLSVYVWKLQDVIMSVFGLSKERKKKWKKEEKIITKLHGEWEINKEEKFLNLTKDPNWFNNIVLHQVLNWSTWPSLWIRFCLQKNLFACKISISWETKIYTPRLFWKGGKIQFNNSLLLLHPAMLAYLLWHSTTLQWIFHQGVT